MKTQDRARILVVDDMEKNRQLLARIVGREGYEVIEATGGTECLDVARQHCPDLVLMDVLMPDLDGIATTAALREMPDTSQVPIILVSASNERDNRIEGIEKGATDFIVKPIDSRELLLRIRNALAMKQYQDLLAGSNDLLLQEKAEADTQLSESRRAAEDLRREMGSACTELITRLSRALEYKDFENPGHLRRIGMYARLLAVHMGMQEQTADILQYASYLHDIGKLAVSDKILMKSGQLSDDEWELLKSHTVMGGRLLEGASSALVQTAHEVATRHHERFDGSGYPGGLAGGDIPLSARIVALCDVYDTLRCTRPYKAALGHADAVAALRDGDDRSMPSHFDPAVLQAFLEVHEDFAEIYETHE